LEKVKWPTKEETWARALKEWKRIESISMESRLNIKSSEFVSIKAVLFKEYEDVVEKMGEQDKENQ
jgi:hypothetical protein